MPQNRARHRTSERAPVSCFIAGLVAWALATSSVIAVYAPVLFWMRALQVLVLLFVVPFFLALGRPVTTLRAALPETGQRRVDRILASRACRIVASPLCTSAAMLGLPWLLYLTPWYVASMAGVVGAVTRILLVMVGFGYFYARVQSDPVPRRYPPLLSVGISVVESLGDGLLGLVLWLGPVDRLPLLRWAATRLGSEHADRSVHRGRRALDRRRRPGHSVPRHPLPAVVLPREVESP